SLEMINERLREMGVQLHLSEVKGPVMDRLKEQHFLKDLTGQVFLSQYEATQKIALMARAQDDTGAEADPKDEGVTPP
ncbi:MAG: hypothetical protein WAO69_08970, partial [Aestuariivita sp.]